MGGEDASGNEASLNRTMSRQEVVRRQQELQFEELKKMESEASRVDGVNSKLPIQAGSGVKSEREGDYSIKKTKSHVIKIKSNEDTAKLRIKQLIAGAGSGAVTKTAVAPLERVKILLQVQGMKMQGLDKSDFKYRGVFGTMRTVLREEGFLALYNGNGANVLRVVPVYALKFSFNETFKDMVRSSPGENLSFSRLIVAGTMAGLFQTCVTYPLETVRTRLTLGVGLGVHYNGIFDVIRQTVRTEGVGGLYKGIGPTILSGSPYVGLQMTFYEIFKRQLEPALDRNPVLVQLERLGAGALAGIIAQTITYPGDTVRRRMQMNGMKGEIKLYSSSWDCTVKLVRAEGPAGLFNGLGANLIRCIPGAAIQFWAFDYINSVLAPY